MKKEIFIKRNGLNHSLARFNQSGMIKTRLGVAVRYEHVLDTPRARLFFSMDVIILAV
jgi:hypothetical protein